MPYKNYIAMYLIWSLIVTGMSAYWLSMLVDN